MLYDPARRERGLLLGLVAVSLLTVTVLASGLSSVEVQSSRQLAFGAVRQIADLANLSMSGSALSALSFPAGGVALWIAPGRPNSAACGPGAPGGGRQAPLD